MNRTLKVWIAVIITLLIIFFIIEFLVNALFSNIGGVNYLYMPFPMKVTFCGSAPQAFLNCTYPWVLWGLITSIIFWILLIYLTYKYYNKKFNIGK